MKKPPTPRDIYLAIKSSLESVVIVRVNQKEITMATKHDFDRMLDELARNAAQSVVYLLPDGGP